MKRMEPDSAVGL